MTMTATTTTATTNKKATHLRLHHSIFAKYQRLSYGLFTLPPTVNVELIQMFNLCFFGFLFPRSCLPLYIAQHEFINSFHDLSVFSLIILCSIAEKNLTEHVVTIFRMKMKTTTTMTTTRAKKIKHHKFPNIKGTKNVNMCGFVIWKDSSSRIVVSPFCTFLRAATNHLIPTISSDYNILLLNTFHVDNIAGRKHFFSATHRTHHCSTTPHPNFKSVNRIFCDFHPLFPVKCDFFFIKDTFKCETSFLLLIECYSKRTKETSSLFFWKDFCGNAKIDKRKAFPPSLFDFLNRFLHSFYVRIFRRHLNSNHLTIEEYRLSFSSAVLSNRVPTHFNAFHYCNIWFFALPLRRRCKVQTCGKFAFFSPNAIYEFGRITLFVFKFKIISSKAKKREFFYRNTLTMAVNVTSNYCHPNMHRWWWLLWGLEQYFLFRYCTEHAKGTRHMTNGRKFWFFFYKKSGEDSKFSIAEPISFLAKIRCERYCITIFWALVELCAPPIKNGWIPRIT